MVLFQASTPVIITSKWTLKTTYKARYIILVIMKVSNISIIISPSSDSSFCLCPKCLLHVVQLN